ncbi:MAG: cytochrome oxidase small assembly protein [Thiobacillaceae bacterium]
MDQPNPRRKNARTGLILAVIAVAVFVYSIWSHVHDKV